MSYFSQAAFDGLRSGRDRQQRNSVALLFFLTLVWALLLPPADLIAPGIAFARTTSSQEQTSYGKLIIVSPNSNIVIIDADLSGRQRILGGKLAPDAVLIRNTRKAGLREFKIGDQVKVHWRHTRVGKQIISLILTEEAPPPTSKPARSSGTLYSAAPTEPIPTAYMGHGLYTSPVTPVIGTRVSHVVGPKETLLKIARKYSLGYNEIVDLYPHYDPWLPPEGKRLALPTKRILPDARRKGIVINIAELRLYYYYKHNGSPMVTTYPVSIGTPEHQTPLGRYHIATKTVDPTWVVPPSLRQKYSFRSIPPGPDNPLGKYWLGLSIRAYGIHGTDIAWSVGRTITQGCIRMYPEDIERFFGVVKMGTRVNLVYQPVKATSFRNRVYIEVHKDVYSKHHNLQDLAKRALGNKDLWRLVDRRKLEIALKNKSGIPVDITNSSLQAMR